MAVKVHVYGTADLRQIERARKELNRLEADTRKNASGYKGSMARMSAATETLGNRLRGVAPEFLAMGAVAGFAIKDVTDAASNLAEATNKSTVVFGENADAVLRWAADSAQAMGLSERAALEASGTYGNLFRAIGLTERQSAQFSMTLTSLASDLASFNNTTTDDALLALRSGLVGETEPLKRFGVNLNEARLKEEALRLGLIRTATGTLPASAKAQAAYSLILQDTSLAQGDFARTADGLANSQRILQAEFENSKAKLGEELIPTLLDATKGTTDLLESFNELPGAVRSTSLELAGFGAAGLATNHFVKKLTGAGLIPWFTKATTELGLSSVAFQNLAGQVGLAQSAMTAVGPAMIAFGSKEAYQAQQTRILNDALASKNETIRGGGQILNSDIEITAKGIQIVDKSTAATEKSAKATGKAADANKTAADAAKVGAAATEESAEAQRAAADAATKYTRDIHGLKVELDSLAGIQRTAKEADLDWRRAALDAADAHDEVTKLRKAGKKGTEEYARAVIAAEEADLRLADAAHESADAFVRASLNVKTLDGNNQELADSLGKAKLRVQELKTKLDTVPKEKRSKVEADIKKAEENVRRIIRQIESIPDKEVDIYAKISFTKGARTRAVIDGKVTNITLNAAGQEGVRSPQLGVFGEDSPRYGEWLINKDRAMRGDPRQFALIGSLLQGLPGTRAPSPAGNYVDLRGATFGAGLTKTQVQGWINEVLAGKVMTAQNYSIGRP